MKSNNFKSYLILLISVVLSGIVGYYLSSYFSSPLIPILITSALAIILVQLFELSLTQLKQKNHLVDETVYSVETLKVIEQLQIKLQAKNNTAQLYTLHWPTKQYVELKRGEAFSSQHSLVYASQDNPRIIALSDSNYFTMLPEVMALDIQNLLKQHNATYVIPLHENKSVYGFIFINANGKPLDHEITEIASHSSGILGQLLQHDAITNVVNTSITNRSTLRTLAVPWQSKVLLVYFLIMTAWWFVTPYVKIIIHERYLFDFGNIYGFSAAWGGICGLVVAREYRKQKNISGAFLFFAVGLLLQEFGQLSYAVYYVLWGTQIPYPSIGDIGYFGSALAYIVGVVFLAKATGVSLKLRTFQNRLLAVIVPILMLLIGYLLFLQQRQFDWNEPLRIFLDFGYPFFQAVYVSIAILIYTLTRDTKGAMKSQVALIVIALIWQFICDYTFLYQASRGTWEVNGLNDYMYLLSYVLMSIAMLLCKKN